MPRMRRTPSGPEPRNAPTAGSAAATGAEGEADGEGAGEAGRLGAGDAEGCGLPSGRSPGSVPGPPFGSTVQEASSPAARTPPHSTALIR